VRKQDRLEEPAVLRDGAVKWAEAWVKNHSKGKSWRWPIKDGTPVNQPILAVLKEQSARHCSFCDGFPVDSLSVETIEHFYPKSVYPGRAFEWKNLFYCCTRCQAAKKERFDDALLKPDEAGYEFGRYFVCDYTTGRIEPNPASSSDEQQRALATIDLYQLNSASLPDERKRAVVFRSKMPDESIDDFAYRFFLE
jgi:uncharacterized protein (TIGR02646 family)